MPSDAACLSSGRQRSGIVGGGGLRLLPSNDPMDIHDSLQRILQAKDHLAIMFYDHFLDKFPEVRPYFENVDFGRQRILLTTALMIIERYYSNPTPAIEQYLQYLGTRHHEMKIPREMYAKWIIAMIDTMQRFHGTQWSPELEQQWREAIDRARVSMFQGYDVHITV
jgi:hemoglobin-like flavoprotein